MIFIPARRRVPVIPPSNATLLLHFEGADGETNIVDSSVHAWTMTGHDACKISTNQAKWGSSSLRLARALNNEGLLAISASAELAHAANVPWWVDFWIYPVTCNSPNSVQPFYFISTDGGTGGGSYTVGIQVIRSGLNFFSGMHWQSSSEGSLPAFPQNVWTHIAVGSDGTTMRRFVNGVLAASAATSIPEASSTGTFYVGGTPIGSDTTSDGITEIYIDELRFLLGSCPYTANFTPPTGPY